MLGATVLTYGLFASPDTVVRQAQGLTEFLPGEAAKLIGEQLLNVVETSERQEGLRPARRDRSSPSGARATPRARS